jgi:glucokinase
VRGGLDLGGTKIQAAVLDDDGEIKGKSRQPTPGKGGPPAVVKALANALAEAAADAGVKPGKLEGVGVGSPGAVDAAAGTVAEARNIPEWSDEPYPVGPELSQRVGVPVALGNDVQVAVEAEYRLGAGKGSSSLLGVFWGTGVGGGIVLDGELWEGRGGAGEIGHMVVKSDGRTCPCGRVGCMEAYAGRGAMEARARELVDKGRETVLFEIMEERGRKRLQSGIWERALKAEDELAIELIDRALEALGAGIASAVNLLDVETVVIGGGLGTRLGEPYVKRIEEQMQPHLFVDERPPAVRLAALGDLGGATGAALLVGSRPVS